MKMNFQYILFGISMGKHKTNADKCYLYCHYDIMLHILSLRFVEIKSQILNLSTTEFHLI